MLKGAFAVRIRSFVCNNKKTKISHLDKVGALNRAVVSLTVLREPGNGDAAVVVGAVRADEGISDGRAVALEASGGTRVDNQVGLELVDGVERR